MQRTSTPRLLFLAQLLPYPPDGGANIRTFHILRELARSFDIHALCFYRKALFPTVDRVQTSVRALRQFGVVEAFPIRQEHSRARFLWDHLRSVFTRRSHTTYTYRSTAFSDRLRALVGVGDFDLVHIDSLDLVAYMDCLDPSNTACTHHNIESSLLRRRAASEMSFARRWYVGMQAGFTRVDEQTWAPRFALNVTVSAEDAEVLRSIAPGAPVMVVPNGVDTEAFRPMARDVEGIVFVGGHGWFPNRNGMEYFSQSILPLIRRHADVPVTWVGRAPEAIQKEYEAQHGVRLTGYVDDVRPYLAQAACVVVPLRVGGGTRLKILDALAMGKAVVSTSIGCAGLAVQDGHNILVRDDPEAFAAAVRDVLRDPMLRHRLGVAGRTLVETMYDWRIVGSPLRDAYCALAAERPGNASALHR
jgi:polysaccharide biosynthesis protein PslH